MIAICGIQFDLKIIFIGFSYWFLFGCSQVIFTLVIYFGGDNQDPIQNNSKVGFERLQINSH